MSDTIAKDCLIHYNNQHIQLRRDFLGICAFDRSQFKKKEAPNQECMAMILRLFETLTDHQKQTWYLKAINAKNAGLSVPPEPKEYPLQLAYGAIATLLYHTYEESTIRCCIAYLLSLGYIRRTQARKNSIPVYCLNIEMVQEALKKQAEKELSGVEFNSQSQVLNSTAKRRISTAKAVNSTPDSPNSDPQGSEFNSNNIYKINDKDKKEESTLPSVATSPTASSDDEDAHALSSPSCSLCSEQEDIQPCQECGTRLCFAHRRDFPSETGPTRVLCVTCLQRHNREMVETPSANTELVSAIAPANGKAEPLIASTTATSQPAPAKAARKPRAPKAVDDGLQARIERVYAFFDTLGQEVTEDSDYHYRKTKKATEAIVEWLKSNPTEAILREVYLKLWNTPADQRSGFDWQQNMSIVAVLGQYDRMALAIKASRKGSKSNLHLVASASRDSGLKSYSREELLKLPV